jgi:hypothetical protein
LAQWAQRARHDLTFDELGAVSIVQEAIGQELIVREEIGREEIAVGVGDDTIDPLDARSLA